MKGIILAGGSGTRLYPITQSISKQLLPVYDKPMIYYPLSTLMLAGIREILIITTPHDQALFQHLLGDGSQFGINLEYKIQDQPKGLAEALIIGEEFLNNQPCCLILGDNLFYGHNLQDKLQKVVKSNTPTIFGYYVKDPERYGVIEFDETNSNRVIGLHEKPAKPQSNYAIVGLYFYDGKASQYAKQIQPSPRGELEITDLNSIYLNNNNLQAELLGRGIAWLDTGTCSSLLQATQFIQTIQDRQGLKIACLEEIAYNNNWITSKELQATITKYKNNEYGQYLQNLLESR